MWRLQFWSALTKACGHQVLAALHARLLYGRQSQIISISLATYLHDLKPSKATGFVYPPCVNLDEGLSAPCQAQGCFGSFRFRGVSEAEGPQTAKYQNGIRLKSNVLVSSQIAQIALTASYENRSYIIRLRIVVPVPNLHYCTIAGTRKTRSEKNHANSYQRSKQGRVVQVLWLLQSNWPVAFLELFSSCVCSRQVSVNPNFHKHLQETAEEGARNNFDTSYWAWISLPNQASKIWLSIFVTLHQDSLLGHRKNERRHILLQFCCCASRFFFQAQTYIKHTYNVAFM